jgi:general secretion pathway protein E/type IV pilus assembly protein PilB
MLPPNEDYILDLLLHAGLLSREQIDHARARLNGENRVVDALVREGVLNADDLSRSLAAHAHMSWIDLAGITVAPEVIEEIGPIEARRFEVIPISRTDHGLVVATGNPLDFHSVDTLSFLLKKEIELVCTTPEKIHEALIKYYGTTAQPFTGSRQQIGDSVLDERELNEAAEPAKGGDSDAPIIRLVSLLLLEAHKLGASDIHLEPLATRFRVRFRVDGVLIEMNSPPKKLQSTIISRLKIMTGTMSIAEKRLPQDGRIQMKMGRTSTDLRVSTIPTNHGESMVMRVLDKSNLLLGLPELGFFSDDQETFERLLRAPDGIVLVTGPTGSGKTSTLYACLNYLNQPNRKIITVEEPVEYQIAGINQVQVNPEIGMTFPAALRSILRQAPNIIMIGEIRDFETASIATNASLTGHLVFSTLHTNDAPSAVARLLDLGMQPFLVATSIRAVMAQRLVRRLCPNCKEPCRVSLSELRALNLEESQLAEATVMGPVGCAQCRQTGYKGRMGIFEIFQIDEEVRQLVNARASTMALRQRARELGMRSLRADGARKVLAGLTSAEEVISITTGNAD